MKKTNRAFSLIELSIVILIIGVLIAATGQGIELLADAKVSAAKQTTQSSRVGSIKGLSLWLETVSDQSFLTTEAADGSSVSTWLDINIQSSDRNSPAQTTVGNRPIYTASAINSLPALKFDGVDDFLSFPSPYLIPNGSSAYTVFFVAAPENTGKTQEILRADPGIAAQIGYVSATQYKCGRFVHTVGSAWLGSSTPARAPTLGIKSPVICTSKYDGSALQGLTNGIADSATNQVSGPVAVGINATYVGKDNAAYPNSNFAKGYIGEIIVFSRALTAKEVDTVEAYLGKKWNIKLN